MDSVTWNTAIDDLAKKNAHSAAKAQSIQCDVSGMIDGGVTKKSFRALLSVMKRLPVDFPPGRVGKDEFDHLLANMGKRCVKRPPASKQASMQERKKKASKKETKTKKK